MMLAQQAFRQNPANSDQVGAISADLMRDGYVTVPHVLHAHELERLYTELDPHFRAARFGNGRFYGGHTKRFGAVLRRSAQASALVLHPLIFPLVEDILLRWCGSIRLNLTQAIEIHPGAEVQVPHRDQDMWGGPKGNSQYMINVMWALDDFTPLNGATRIWPGSHLSAQDEMLGEDEAICAAMPRGSATLFLGSTLHSGGANNADRPRRGLIISYCLGWLRSWENQFLAYPPDIARRLDPKIAGLIGYRQHLPSLGNYEGQCPSVLLQDRADEPLAFTDALRGDQLALMDQYYQSIASRDAGSVAGDRSDAIAG